MAAVGGDVTEISYSHPTIGQGVFYPKAAEDNTFDPGGFKTGDDANMIDGSGQMIKQINRTRWSFEGTISGDMNSKMEMEKLNSLSGDPVDATFTISHINGAVYKGAGTVVGDANLNGNNATIKLKLAGGGKMKKIAG